MLFTLLLSLHAFAADDFTLDAISVRGTKDDRAYTETTESLTTVDEAYLNQAGRENSLTVLNAMPNVQVNKGGETFSVRGINNTGVTGFQQRDNLASILVDDVFQTDLAVSAGSFDLWDSERVELLRGAQSATQGVNSLAGSFLLYHLAPRFADEGAAKLGVGNFGGRELGLVLNRELNPGKTAARLSYNKEWNKGFVTNTTTGEDDAGGRNKDKAGLAVTQKLGEKTQLTLDGKFHRQRDGAPYAQGSDAFRDEIAEDVEYRRVTRNYQASARLGHEISERLRNDFIAAFSHSSQDIQDDGDFEATNRLGRTVDEARDRFFSVENLFKYRSERVNNVLGLHAHAFRLNDEHRQAFPLSGVTIPIHQTNERNRYVVSLFDSYLYHFNETHGLNVGGRLEYVSNEYFSRVDATDTGNAGVDAYLASRRGENRGKKENFILLPKAAYLLDLGNHHLAASYTRGYRTGGVSINRRQARAVEYGPEFTDNYELAYKLPLTDFLLSANAFYTDWADQQVQVKLSNDFFDTQVNNASRSRLWGGELQARRQFGKQAASLGFGYTNTSFLDFKSGTTDYQGNEFPFAPRYTVYVTHEIKPITNLTLTTTGRLLGKSFTDAENTRRAPTQLQLDLDAQYSLGSVVLEAFANNLLNRRYLLVDGTPTAALAASGYPAARHRVNAPRELGLRATYLW